jgi:hypothetical protein
MGTLLHGFHRADKQWPGVDARQQVKVDRIAAAENAFCYHAAS